MRVLVLSSTFPNSRQPNRGVFVRERISRLAQRCDVVVVSPIPWFPLNRWLRSDRASAARVENQNVLTVYHPRFFSLPRYATFLNGFFYALSPVPFLVRLRRRFPFEVIDAHFAFPDGVAATLLDRLFRCPVVIILRDSIARLSTYRLHRPQIRWALSRAQRVTTISGASRLGSEVPASGSASYPTASMSDASRWASKLSPGGLADCPSIAPSFSRWRQSTPGRVSTWCWRRWRHSGNAILTCFTSWSMPRGPRRPLPCDAVSPSSGSRTTFASQGRSHTPISGNGSNAANVFVLATRLGRIPQEQVRDLYILLEVLVLPRQRMRLTELVTPLKPLEAMAAGTPGTPVLASDIGGHAEMIADGETGLLFKAESRDSLIEQATRVAADAGLRRHLSENARHFVERERTWDRVVARYLPVYDAVASRTGGRV